jgi:hypothetical protein
MSDLFSIDGRAALGRLVAAGWVTVKVGLEGPTAARFRLSGQAAVAGCLELLLRLR